MRNKKKVLLWLSKREQNPLFGFIYKYYEPLAYLFFGFLTTIVNFSIYTFLEITIGQENWYISNVPAIFFAILFAYITNRSFVFDSDGKFWVEMYKFFVARITISFTFEYLASFIMFNVMGFAAQLTLFSISVSWFKIIAVTFVLVGNYLASKFIIFRTGAKEQ